MVEGLDAQVARIYREEAGVIVASLMALTRDLGAAEDLLQDALARALEVWRRDGVPPNPGAWLMVTARNRALDRYRRTRVFAEKSAMLEALEQERSQAPDYDRLGGFPDERLRLIFTCCHPVLSAESRVALTLRAVCGLETEQIAKAFLAKPATMAQRLVRAKQKLRDEEVPYEIPEASELPERLESVLDVIYLVFNEGYHSSTGTNLVDADLCVEAIRLGKLVHGAVSDEPEVSGLLALMLLHDARRDTRVDADGNLVLLEAQDRTAWNHGQISEAAALVEVALRRGNVGPFQLQAAIAALHATAPDAEATDWPQITGLYALLARIQPTAVVKLNQAVAVSYAAGPEAAVGVLASLEPELSAYSPFWATKADVERRLGRLDEARHAYELAIKNSENAREIAFFERRILELGTTQ